ncbi:metallophosphoesterase family protein [Salisaeta longa]|uniref:metallophosphoesterase family protein n=1 Tax=Salisaeta longa TaxID=503170 RepID=UPI0003B508EC|nr:metallophosphoesterase [Salisaeta longa]
MTIAHISDMHFGRIAHPGVVDALADDINAAGIDVVACSGDLTQRARRHEFAAARDFLDALDPPTLVVPGNHDTYPWWHPIKRLTRPLGRYRRYISDAAHAQHRSATLYLLGLNSTRGFTIKGGRILPSQRQRMQRFFADAPSSALRVLMLHHHLTKIRALGSHDVARHARAALDAAARAGVDLILCGHLHISHIEPVEVVPGTHRIVVATAGTATSSRGRKADRGVNFYNRIRITDEAFTVAEHRFDPADEAFAVERQTTFRRADSEGPSASSAPPALHAQHERTG